METALPKSLPLSKVSEPRWKWMALSGAAVGAASASSALAGTVQITHLNNLINAQTNTLDPDLTGDGVPDLVGLNGVVGPYSFKSGGKWHVLNRALISAANPGFNNGVAKSFVRAGRVQSGNGNTNFQGTIFDGFRVNHPFDIDTANRTKSASKYAPLVNSGLIPVVFTDPRINGGAATNGLLETRAGSTSFLSHTIRLVRIVFDDASVTRPAGVVTGGTVPEFSVSPAAPAALAALRAESAALKAKVVSLTKMLKKSKANKAKAKKLKKSIKTANARIAVLAGQI